MKMLDDDCGVFEIMCITNTRKVKYVIVFGTAPRTGPGTGPGRGPVRGFAY